MTHKSEDMWENIRIARPCKADWEKMTGDEKVRFCGQCKKNVYDISSMSKAEAEQLMEEKEGKMCVRLFRRRDGKILTADCPKGVAAFRAKVYGAVGAVVAVVVGGMYAIGLSNQQRACRGPMMGEMYVEPAPNNVPRTDNGPESNGKVQ